MSKLLLEGVVGSRAYGMNHAGSDYDYLGVELLETGEFFDFQSSPSESRNWTDEQGDDHTVHELGKFMRLAFSANPTVNELLWLEDDGYVFMSDVGRELVNMRSDFLSQKVGASYSGFVASQARRANREGNAYKDKLARHFYRLVLAAKHVWVTGELKVRLSADEISAVRYFEAEARDNREMFVQVDAQLQDFLATMPSALPESPDYSRAQEFLLEVRKSYW